MVDSKENYKFDLVKGFALLVLTMQLPSVQYFSQVLRRLHHDDIGISFTFISFYQSVNFEIRMSCLIWELSRKPNCILFHDVIYIFASACFKPVFHGCCQGLQ